MAKKVKLPDAWAGTGGWKRIKSDDPKLIAKLCKVALQLDGKRLEMQKATDALEAEVKQIKEVLHLTMNTVGMKEAKTTLGVVRLVPKDVYQMDSEAGGWPKIWEYIKKNDAWDIIEKRLHQGACKERYLDNKKIPAVKVFQTEVVKLGESE